MTEDEKYLFDLRGYMVLPAYYRLRGEIPWPPATHAKGEAGATAG